MAISHELSSEIATALFAGKIDANQRSPRELNDLKILVLKIHSTLEQLTDDARLDRHRSQPAIEKASGKY